MRLLKLQSFLCEYCFNKRNDYSYQFWIESFWFQKLLWNSTLPGLCFPIYLLVYPILSTIETQLFSINSTAEVVCPTLTPLLNGKVAGNCSNVVGSACTFLCDDGYHILGEQQITCVRESENNVGASWNHQKPTCEREYSFVVFKNP